MQRDSNDDNNQRGYQRSSPSNSRQYSRGNDRGGYNNRRGNSQYRNSDYYQRSPSGNERYNREENEVDERPKYSPRRYDNQGGRDYQEHRHSPRGGGRNYYPNPRRGSFSTSIKTFLCDCGQRLRFSTDLFKEGVDAHLQSQEHLNVMLTFKDAEPSKERSQETKEVPKEGKQEENEPKMIVEKTCECGAQVRDTINGRKKHKKLKQHIEYMQAKAKDGAKAKYEIDPKLVDELENFGKKNRLFEKITKAVLDYYASAKAPPEELAFRETARKKFQEFIQTKWKGATLHLFGSSLSNLFTSKSDIDFCLMIANSPLQDEEILTQLNKYIRKQLNAHTICLAQARVPIIKLVEPHPHMPVKFDLCVNRMLGVKNSTLIATYVDLDERVRPLIFIIKQFGKQFDILNPSHGLTSYGLNLLIIFFLQTRTVLPNLQANANTTDKFDDVVGYNCYFETPKGYKSKNTQTLGQLLVEFFLFYSCFDFSKKVVSIRTAKPLSLDEVDFEPSFMCIEDPFETDFNCSRLVQHTWFTKIMKLFKTAYDYLSQHEQLPPVEAKPKPEEKKAEEQQPAPNQGTREQKPVYRKRTPKSEPQENQPQQEPNQQPEQKRPPKQRKQPKQKQPEQKQQPDQQQQPEQKQTEQKQKTEQKQQPEQKQQDMQPNQDGNQQQKQSTPQEQRYQRNHSNQQRNQRYRQQYRRESPREQPQEEPQQQYDDDSFAPPDIPRNSLQRVSHEQNSPSRTNGNYRNSPQRNYRNRNYERESYEDQDEQYEQPRRDYPNRGRGRGRGYRDYSRGRGENRRYEERE